MPGFVASPLDDPDTVRRHTVNLLRLLARRWVVAAPTDEQIRHIKWDTEARKEDAKITRCERCDGWSWQYPVCGDCRRRHQRQLRRTA